MERVDYIFNIQSFDQLYDIAKERKGTDYNQYLGIHLDYLYGFLRRVKPLIRLCGEIRERETGGAFTHTGAHLDLSAFSCPEELASLVLDRLKSSLMALGLKCGGTLDGRAVRLFSINAKESV